MREQPLTWPHSCGPTLATWILVAELGALACCAALPTSLVAQDNGQATTTTAANPASDKGAETSIAAEIDALGDPSYRVRQLARWRLEQSPLEALAAIDDRLRHVDFNTGGQLIDLLSALATHNDMAISVRARETLRTHANRVTSIGRKADTALRAIADLQEAQALKILTHHGARFGSPNGLGFTLNARLAQESSELALWIDQSFTGDDDTIDWIQCLKSIDTVFFEGPDIHAKHFQAIAQLPNIKNVKLKHVSVTADDLQALASFQSLELLELCYVDVDDSYLELLAKLPISQSLRLYGTRISSQGAERLAEQLDGIEIYCGKGGYLGIATQPQNTLVTEVISGSGAQLAGIMYSDELTHVDGVAIKNMTDLRTELGKHLAGDHIVISLKRSVSTTDKKTGNSVIETVELKLDVTLGEDPK